LGICATSMEGMERSGVKTCNDLAELPFTPSGGINTQSCFHSEKIE
jgi:hypothetical protein